MYVFDASDRDTFLAHRPAHFPIRIVRMPTTQLIRQRNLEVTTVPAVELTYSFINGDQQWVFREICTAAEDVSTGRVDLSSTLWVELGRLGLPYEFIQHSGSF